MVRDYDCHHVWFSEEKSLALAHSGHRPDVRVSNLLPLVHGHGGKISGWIGLPEYEGYVPSLQRRGTLWSGLAVIFPFLAAFLLGLGKGAGQNQAESSHASVITAPEVSHEWTVVTAILAYLLRVAISLLASLTFAAALIVVVSLLEKLGVRAH